MYTNYVSINRMITSMNLTLSIDEKTLKKAREAARAQGMTINQLVRDYLQQFSNQSDLENSIALFHKTCRQGHSANRAFTRDDLHERS